MKLPVLLAADGTPWEAALVVSLEMDDLGVVITRRCVDVIDLLAVAAAGLAQVALVAADLPHLDGDAIDRLRAAGVVPVGLVPRGDFDAEVRIRALGIDHLVPFDAEPKVIADVALQAALVTASPGTGRGWTDPTRPITGTVAPLEFDGSPRRRGSVIAVWGPTGAPGRTTVAVSVADELARLGNLSLLVDADVYGGVVGPSLGLLDESPGIAAACRSATSGRLDLPALAALCWQVRPSLRVLTGIPRAERWPELRPVALGSVLEKARGLADFVVVDCGFCLESDEELSFDSLAPRRNGATLAVLDAADLILVVGSADPLGLQRLVRALIELREAEVTVTSWIVLNRVRAAVAPGNTANELGSTLERFTGRAASALLPLDQDAVDAAIATGRTLSEVRPSSVLRRAIVELAAGLAGVEVPGSRRRRRARSVL